MTGLEGVAELIAALKEAHQREMVLLKENLALQNQVSHLKLAVADYRSFTELEERHHKATAAERDRFFELANRRWQDRKLLAEYIDQRYDGAPDAAGRHMDEPVQEALRRGLEGKSDG